MSYGLNIEMHKQVGAVLLLMLTWVGFPQEAAWLPVLTGCPRTPLLMQTWVILLARV